MGICRVMFAASGAVIINLLAAALLAPLLIAATVLLLLNTLTLGGVLDALVLAERLLPADAVWSGPVAAAVVLSCPALLLFACLRLWWLFPSALLVSGGAAEAYLLGMSGAGQNLELGIPMLGAAGMLLSAIRLLLACRVYRVVPV